MFTSFMRMTMMIIVVVMRVMAVNVHKLGWGGKWFDSM